MFELWVLVDDYGMFCAFESDNLTALREIEYNQALNGTITEIRIKGKI